MALNIDNQYDFFREIKIDDDGNLCVWMVNGLINSGGTVNGDVFIDGSLSALTYYSGSTPLETIIYDIAQSTELNTFTTAATLNGTVLTFDRNDALSAYTVDLATVVNSGDYLPLTGGTLSGITFQALDAQDANQPTPDFTLDGGGADEQGFEFNTNSGLAGGSSHPDGHHIYKVDLMTSGSAYTFSGEINVLSIASLTEATTVRLPQTPLRDFYIVKDKTGNAGTYPISISAGGTLINGNSSYIVNINTKPSITFLFDGVEYITI